MSRTHAFAVLAVLSIGLSAGSSISSADSGVLIDVSDSEEWGNPTNYQPHRCQEDPFTRYQLIERNIDRDDEFMADREALKGEWGERLATSDLTLVTSRSASETYGWGDRGGAKVAVHQLTEVVYASFEPLEQRFDSSCVAVRDVPEEGILAGDVQPGSGRTLWVPVISEAGLAGDAFLHLSRYLHGPDLDFVRKINEAGEYDDDGFVLVKVPWPVEVAPTGPVTVTLHAENLAAPRGLSVSITARPVELVVDGGDPDVEPVVCSFDEVESLGCWYEFYNASSIRGSEHDHAFEVRSGIVWEVSTSAGGLDVDRLRPTTWSTSSIQVGEANAIVTG